MPSPPVPRRSVLALAAAGAMFGAVGALSGCTPSPTPGPTSAKGRASSPKPSSAPPTAAGPGTLHVTGTVAQQLSTPWALAVLPDGAAFVSERDSGRILQVTADGGAPREVARIPVRGGTREGGLLGLEPSPTFDRDGLLYAYYTGAAANRVVSLSWDGKSLGNERVLVDHIPASVIHDGGRVRFGPDGFLYIGTGDANTRSTSLDMSSLGGKILRVAPDGSPAPGNPFGSGVYTFGHRNVQGLAWDSHGRLWSTELGPERNDELNLVTPGRSYGWPSVTGATSNGSSVPAAFVWPTPADASPSGIAVLDDAVYVACLRGERLWRIPLPGPGYSPDGSGTLPGATEHLRGEYGRLRDVVRVPGKNELLLLTNEGEASRILRVAA